MMKLRKETNAKGDIKMDVSVIDQNLRAQSVPNEADLVWYDAAKVPFVTYGAWQTSPCYLRMPPEAAEAANEGVVQLNSHTAGIRLRFCTDSPYIAIHAEWTVLSKMSHMPVSGICGFDLYTVKNGQYAFAGALIPPSDVETGYESILYTDGQMTEYVLNFPLYNEVTKLSIGLQKEAVFGECTPYANMLPVVFYGSSITQGGCASRPGNCYENFLSRALNMDYVNLGFSGSGRAEPELVKYMASMPMAAFVSDYDHNAPDAAYLAATHEAMYRAIRAQQPELPYVMVSRPDFKKGNDELRSIVMETYHKAIAEGDKNAYFVDGAGLFSGEEWDACTVDGCHPNDLGFYRMAQGMLPWLKKILFR